MDYRYGSHTVFQIEYHFVWVTKYRYKVLTGDVAERMRELVRQTCTSTTTRLQCWSPTKSNSGSAHRMHRPRACARVWGQVSRLKGKRET